MTGLERRLLLLLAAGAAGSLALIATGRWLTRPERHPS